MHDETDLDYLLPRRPSERERIRLQARVWEPAGRSLLERLPAPAGARVVDVGCGAMGWLRLLSEWVGPRGEVVGTDADPGMLEAAREFCAEEGLRNVTLRQDDVFASGLPAGAFDLVHVRFMITPLGRAAEQLALYRGLARPGGRLVLEECDSGPWRLNPEAPATMRLIGLIREAFRAAGGDLDAGRSLPGLLREAGLEPEVHAHVLALPPGHHYLRVPLNLADSLRQRLETLLPAGELDALVRASSEEVDRPGTWGTTFMVVQAHTLLPA